MQASEKYRPQFLRDVLGQSHVTDALRGFVAAPYATGFLFDDDTGTGKTSTAYALARELGCSLAHFELGGLSEVASGEQTADNVRAAMQRMSYRPFYGSGWKVLIVNEADRMNTAAETIWLDALEHLPAYTVVVFTTNNPEKLSARFRDRCERFTFNSEFETLKPAVKQLVMNVWQQETGILSAPKDLMISRIVQDGRVSFRRALQEAIRLARVAAVQPAVA